MPGDVPWEIRLTLRPGSVYYFADRALSSPEPHFFIVVNRDPLGAELLLLTVVTSQIEKVKRFRRDQPDTVVDLDQSLYDELKKSSVVDGNSLFKKSLAEFADLVRGDRIRHHKDLPPDLLARIQTAIHSSRLISSEDRALIDLPPTG